MRISVTGLHKQHTSSRSNGRVYMWSRRIVNYAKCARCSRVNSHAVHMKGGGLKMKGLSEETKKEMFKFFLKTSIPRLLQQEAENEKRDQRNQSNDRALVYL